MIEVLGYIGAVVIGVTLGLIGGGGSILTVPVLVYMLGIDPLLATSYSLFIVGTSSFVGAIKTARKGLVEYRTAIIFGIPAIISVYLTRAYLVPAIPAEVMKFGALVITDRMAIMLLFAAMMILAAFSMIAPSKSHSEKVEVQKFNYPMILLEGVGVGVLTGLVGAGGGFLIIPALVILSKLPMKMAVGTSLSIIAAKSLIGFTGDLSNFIIDWNFLAIFTTLSVAGIFIGTYLSKFIPGKKLKPAFGWFVLAMGIYIMAKELF
ncbi:MAG: sulfite exporter TauE/SafE family protein [Flavobacteriales bacterium]|nr:sulfite exporter TauE/SafE family protein [Flavobacteriales bacterium]